MAAAFFLLIALFGALHIRAENPEPPREIPLKEVEFGELSNVEMGDNGQIAIEIDREKWRHAETPNFILHFRRVTEAKKVAREIEYSLWFVAEALGATRDQYLKKSHVFIFEDEDEWKSFIQQVPNVSPWAASFASGDELFLNIRNKSGPVKFDSQLLAHECTHAVVSRLYPNQRWPLFLNEGFAEYMGSASVAARKNQTVGRHQGRLRFTQLPLEQLVLSSIYPNEQEEVWALYQTSEKLVRYLFTKFPPEAFPRFVDVLLEGTVFEKAVMKIYGEKAGSYEKFLEGFSKFET